MCSVELHFCLTPACSSDIIFSAVPVVLFSKPQSIPLASDQIDRSVILAEKEEVCLSSAVVLVIISSTVLAKFCWFDRCIAI